MIELIQWPAMFVTLWASWCVADKGEKRRNFGFWLFMAGNVLWIAWGLHSGAYALVALQVGLALLNIRGASQTDEA